MAGFESPEFLRLYTTYTASPDGIGRHLAQVSIDQGQDDPLIVATGQDMAHFPGGGASPTIEGFRGTTAGFKELTAISHLGPAVASLVRLRTAGDETWRDDAERLLTELESTRAANSVELWRDQIAVEAFRGRETEIAAMVDYSCAVTTRYLSDALADEDHLTPETLRSDYLDSGGTVDVPVPINSMMIATFFLVIMDTSYRLTRWLQSEIADWERAMVIIAGQQGRPTAGVTLSTNSVATMILGASRYELSTERIYLAPHAPTFETPVDGDLSEVIAMEGSYRELWCRTRATAELGEVMYAGYPRYVAQAAGSVDISDRGVTEVSELPLIHSADDTRAMYTRLRVLLEDPRQLLSGCVTDFAVRSLYEVDNDPSKVVVPGLSGITYPAGL